MRTIVLHLSFFRTFFREREGDREREMGRELNRGSWREDTGSCGKRYWGFLKIECFRRQMKHAITILRILNYLQLTINLSDIW